MVLRPRLLISACLVGQLVRYDGRAKSLISDQLSQLEKLVDLFPFCPEVAGGLPTPRDPAEIEPGFTGDDVLNQKARIVDRLGMNVTKAFVEGAAMAVTFAQKEKCSYALLTEASPSCGTNFLYSGHHDGQLRAGVGATAAALRRAGIRCFSSNQADRLISVLRKNHSNDGYLTQRF